jgi:hypothetical protein
MDLVYMSMVDTLLVSESLLAPATWSAEWFLSSQAKAAAILATFL